MEVLREGGVRCSEGCDRAGFNPCFDGSVERGGERVRYFGFSDLGFNPCFDGSVERGCCVV